MKEIPLSRGLVTIVDDDDYEWLTQWEWHATVAGYAARNKPRPDRGIILMHRAIMTPPDDMVVDHINRNPLDNRRENLRVVTHRQNIINMGARKHNTSGFRGVGWDKEKRKWRVQIRNGTTNKFIGRFDTPEEAARAYDEAAKQLHGEVAVLNFPEEVAS